MHGVGLADEYPSIKHEVDLAAKGYEGVLSPGMVICVESFIGVEGGREGVKLEEQVIISEVGVDRMSSLPLKPIGYDMPDSTAALIDARVDCHSTVTGLERSSRRCVRAG